MPAERAHRFAVDPIWKQIDQIFFIDPFIQQPLEHVRRNSGDLIEPTHPEAFKGLDDWPNPTGPNDAQFKRCVYFKVLHMQPSLVTTKPRR